MKIQNATVYVDDQEKALRFYTDKLGFSKKEDVSSGGYRWLTVASPEDPDGTALLLEANSDPAARAYQQALYGQGAAALMLQVENLNAEQARLEALGVVFKMPPTDIGPQIIATLPDTCGNLIQLNQPVKG